MRPIVKWNWQVAEARCRKAIALDPRSAHLRNVYGVLLSTLGRDEEAVAMIRRAVEPDPLGPVWNACLVHALLGTRDWEQVLQQTRTTLDVAPDCWFALFLAGQAHAAAGDFESALATSEHAVRASGEVPYTVGLLGNMPDLATACIHAGLDERDEAFALLDRGLGRNDAMTTYAVTTFPMLDNLRPDPRFAALRRRIGLT